MDILPFLKQVKRASKEFNKFSSNQIDELLVKLSKNIQENLSQILEANRLDLQVYEKDNPLYDRLLLTEKRVLEITKNLLKVAKMPSPLDHLLQEKKLPNGLNLQQITAPMGVIGIIYEARPNITPEVFSLAFKAGSGIVLKGGSDAYNSNSKLVEIIQKTLLESGFNQNIIYLLPPKRELVPQMLTAKGLIDVIIPRGGQKLIDFVRDNAKIPVIETGAGVCHTFVDDTGKLEYAQKIVENAKTRRPSVCNSLDCLLISRSRLNDLPIILKNLATYPVDIYADLDSYEILKQDYPKKHLFQATTQDYGLEFLALKMTVKVVSSLAEALDHIDTYGSGHSEAIISESLENIQVFQRQVDCANIFVNTSTAFADGGEYGFGCEIGISTQKLHARGPMGLEALVTYKWLITGQGQIR